MTGLRILVTGSREFIDRQAVADALGETLARHPDGWPYTNTTLIHGAARGVDTIAAEIAESWGWNVEPYPADWTTFGKAAGPRRNAVMVASGADICLAFPIGPARGTRNCMRLAEKAGIRIINYGDTP